MTTVVIGAGTMRHPTLAPHEKRPNTSAPRLKEAATLLAEAERRGCAVMCLPELFADPSQGTRMRRFAESEDGPVMTWLARMAAKHHMALVTSVALRHGRQVANTGVIFDRCGKLVGQYRKVHLPEGERDMGTPGQNFPIFKLEGLNVGMQICYDLEFSEGCRLLALQGCDIVFWPNMWGGMPEEHDEIIMKARAIENRMSIVSSAFLLSGNDNFRTPKIFGRSCIMDCSGTILAEVGRRLGVAAAALDLAELRENRRRRLQMFRQNRQPRIYRQLAE